MVAEHLTFTTCNHDRPHVTLSSALLWKRNLVSIEINKLAVQQRDLQAFSLTLVELIDKYSFIHKRKKTFYNRSVLKCGTIIIKNIMFLWDFLDDTCHCDN